MIQKPRGTRDFLPDEMAQRRELEQKMRKVATSFGYGEVATPMFEEQELFVLKSGEGILGEMYTFEDKGNRKIALRPELTAPTIRAYVNEAQVAPKPLRWFYFEECFRYERPQKGRYRQFWQFGCELIGADTPEADAEVIALAYNILKSTGVRFVVKVGHLAPMKHLLAEFNPVEQRKVMAALDKRDENILADTLNELGRPNLFEPLMGLTKATKLDDVFKITGDIPEKARIEKTFDYLKSMEIPVILNFGIARGLDYYTGMVFEGFADNLGAENQILGGGVYRLAHLFGGKDTPSCGFGIGFDRVAVSIGEFKPERKPTVAIVCTEESREVAYHAANECREHGIITVMDVLGRGFGAQLTAALKTDATHAIIIGAKEAEKGTVMLKNFASTEQKEMKLTEAIVEVINGTC